MSLETYFDFAENDFEYFSFAYKNGLVANRMGAEAQEICEKYLKHLVTLSGDVSSNEEAFAREKVLKTHSLNRLLKYLKETAGIRFSKEAERAMQIIDGFYFSTRYPGSDSVEIDKENVDNCYEAVTKCREETIKFMEKLEKK